MYSFIPSEVIIIIYNNNKLSHDSMQKCWADMVFVKCVMLIAIQ